jgi:Domain of Unknown Function (DUF1080)
MNSLGPAVICTLCMLPAAFPACQSASQSRAVPLFAELPYSEWRVLGAPPKVELHEVEGQPVLIGKGPIPSNGFLASPRDVGDFRLEVDVKLGSADNPLGDKMNSGIQIRSQEKEAAGGQRTLGGLQVEVDPTKRAWSGGIYDERGRAWLAPLEGNDAARAAFKLGAWNRYEIECIGPRIRTRVNGVECAEWYDGIVSGLIGFQVHGGPPCEVAFRAPMFTELGRHVWRPLADEPSGSSGERVAWSHSVDPAARGVRLMVEGGGHVEVLAADGTRLCDVSFAAGDSRAARALEILWLDDRGAMLLAGRRIGTLALAEPPARIRVLGEACSARDAHVLVRE